MNRLILLLLVSCGDVTTSHATRFSKLEMPKFEGGEKKVGSTIDIAFKVPEELDNMPGDPQVTLQIICEGTEVYRENQLPSEDNRIEFSGVKITDEFRGKCVVSARWQHGSDSLYGSTEFSVTKDYSCIDLATDSNVYLGKQFNVCEKTFLNSDDLKLQCDDKIKIINLHLDIGMPKKSYHYRNDNESVSTYLDTLVVVAKDSVPSNCKVTINSKSYAIIKPPSSGSDKNLAKDMITSVTADDDRIKINLRAKLNDNTGLFIQVNNGGWHMVTSNEQTSSVLTDFSGYYASTEVEVLAYEKTDKGIWWDYYQDDLQ